MSNKKDLCLVTGGGGFLGNHIVRKLLCENYRVRVLDRHANTNLYLQPIKSQIEIITGDTNDKDTLQRALHDVRYLFHYVGATLPADSNSDPVTAATSDLINNLFVFTQAIEFDVEKIIYPSSGGAIYGIPSHIPISEKHDTSPISTYGVIKLALEKYLHLLNYQHGLNYAILRYGNPYGIYQNPYRKFGVISTFLGRVAQNKPLEIWGDGNIIRDFIYIDDAIEATYQALHYQGIQRILNIGSGVGTSVNEIVSLIHGVTGHNLPNIYHPSRPSDVPRIVLDIETAKQELDWTPTVSLERGIQQTWDWVQKIVPE